MILYKDVNKAERYSVHGALQSSEAGDLAGRSSTE